jgi:hypothetical protein
MRKRGQSAALATGLLVGCGSQGAPEIRQHLVEPGPLVDPADSAATLETRLGRDAVDQHKFFRAVLYTWTTSEQIDELRSSRRLLTRDESPTSGASYLDQLLFSLAPRDPLAKLLYTTAFATMRFAWPAPWATRAGWPDEQYGDQLIRITLRDDAWIVHLSTATGAFTVHDQRDAIVPIDQVLASPHRIAAIYFVSDRTQPTAAGLPPAMTTFREYALCNESMIASWEVGTARVMREVEESAATVDAIVRWATASKVLLTAPPSVAWTTPGSGPAAAYQRALALHSLYYEPQELPALASRLRATPRPAAFEATPSVTFVPGTARKPPRIVRHGDSTFARPASMTGARP